MLYTLFHRLHSALRFAKTNKIHATLFFFIFAVIGTVVLLAVKAAANSEITLNVLNGTLAGKASVVSNKSAINGQALQFGTPGSGTGTRPGGGSSSSREHIISTLYAYPTLSSWGQVETATPTVKYAIVNICAPDGTGSGCGRPADEKNPAWIPTIQALEQKGITPLYYISTNYGAIPIATIEQELMDAKTWYGIANPMFDTTATNNSSYYRNLYNFAVANGASTVVFNPGTQVSQSYMFGQKEIIQVYEGTAAGFRGTTFPSWMKQYPASEFSATLSAGSASTVGTDISDAAHDNIGNFYEDDESEPPNYATLPAYWNTEVTDVASVK